MIKYEWKMQAPYCSNCGYFSARGKGNEPDLCRMCRLLTTEERDVVSDAFETLRAFESLETWYSGGKP